jgi:hypothetical protein
MGNVDSSNAFAGVDELKDTLTGLESYVISPTRILIALINFNSDVLTYHLNHTLLYYIPRRTRNQLSVK